ncbi:MAG: hydantoinase/carbamoylase family amidase [Betaproteobacteria bacterium]
MGLDRPARLVFDDADRALAEALFESVRRLSAARVGVTRPSYSDSETAAMGVIAEAAAKAGLATRFDAAANLVVELPGATSQPGYWMGSHLDSVPEGGNYDGLAGVIAGLLCLLKAKALEVTPERALVVLGLRGEESAWFGKPYIGSYALLGRLSEKDLQRKHRDSGRPLGEYMREVGAEVERIAAGQKLVEPQAIGAWLELHIEQGPIMVARQAPVGVVTGIRGSLRHVDARCHGAAGHSGAVPRWLRHDAVFALAELLMRLDENWQALNARGVDLVVTAGIVGTDPREHSVTRIPGDVRFSLDIRSQSLDTLEAFYQLVLVEAASIEKGRGVKFDFGERLLTEPGIIDRDWAARLRKLCGQLELPYIDIPSGAGHDAAIFAGDGVPAAMIFVRNDRGSHNPDEKMELGDFMMGVELLYQAVTNP